MKKSLFLLITLAITLCFFLVLSSCGQLEKADTSTETVQKITLKFDANGGEIVDGESQIKSTAGKSFRAVPTVEREGYKFICWVDEDGEQIEIPFTVPNTDTTYYAYWEKNSGSNTDESNNGDTNSNNDTSTDNESSDSNINNGNNSGTKPGTSTQTPDAFVIMSDDFDGVFNPFFAYADSDKKIVEMTQIKLITAKYVNSALQTAYGEDEAAVAKDFDIQYNAEKNETVYTFVLKNGIKFSDGQPLTMEDVLFNLYVYLDPSYTGSATIYSTKIKGLSEYRTQSNASGNVDQDELIAEDAASRAQARINELVNLFKTFGDQKNGYSATYEDMIEAIDNKKTTSSGYKHAVGDKSDEELKAQLTEDYEYTLKLFRDELNDDWVAAQSAYTESEPYKSHPFFKDEINRFMYHEGFVTVEWGKKTLPNGRQTDDKSVIKSITPMYANLTTKEAAIEYVYNSKVETDLHIILAAWATANQLLTEYTAEAKGVILNENKTEDGKLTYDHVSGIVSLGHNTTQKTVTVNGNTYNIAHEHNKDGTPKNEDEYDVLQITIEGQDPKAKWNFAFSVAPQHYYGDDTVEPVDIVNNKFGVTFGEYGFMKDVIQSPNKTAVPVGAGAYKATNRENGDNPSGTGFLSNNVVYFKANDLFTTVGEGIENAKIKKVRYQALPASDAITLLESGTVHYISPQLTTENYDKLVALQNGGGFSFIQEDQLGYGYIGINADKVQDIELRQAIMCAMNTATSLAYYRSGTASQIYWPMSTVSWAYPKNEDGTLDNANGKDYPYIGNWTADKNGNGIADGEESARKKIQALMDSLDVPLTENDSRLKIEFTIAGASTDHPTFQTFIDAAALLNSMGWDISVVPDATALTKLSSGGLTVWAAAWGSTLDPDMYQVYHKNSTASSTRAWGYSFLRTEGGKQEAILDELSEKIDEAREILDEEARAAIYKEAMSLLLDLAVELPVYQRSVVYAYNSDVIDESSFPSGSNPYSSPLDRIWELEFKD